LTLPEQLPTAKVDDPARDQPLLHDPAPRVPPAHTELLWEGRADPNPGTIAGPRVEAAGDAHIAELLIFGSTPDANRGLRLTGKIQALVVSLGCEGGDGEGGAFVDTAHLRGLGIPVVFITLNDAKPVNPDVGYSESAGEVDRVPESRRKL